MVQEQKNLTYDSTNIIEFIKKNYPKVVFSPFKLAYSNALGFIITGGKLIVGFINKKGTVCKLIEPIDINKMGHSDLSNAIKKIPIVSGFTEEDRQKLIDVFHNVEDVVSKEEHLKITNELKKKMDDLNKKETEYKILFDSKTNNTIAIKTEYENKIKLLNEQYDILSKESEQCKKQIVEEKDNVIMIIQKFKDEMKNTIASKELKIEELENLYRTAKNERKVIEEHLNSLIKNEERKLNKEKELSKLLDDKNLEINDKNAEIKDKTLEIKDKTLEINDKKLEINNKENELTQLKNTISDIKKELDKTKEELNKSSLQQIALSGFKSRCSAKILTEKEEIIKTIKKYNDNWFKWSQNIKTDIKDHQKNLIIELHTAHSNLKNILEEKKKLIQEKEDALREKQLAIDEKNKIQMQVKTEVESTFFAELDSAKAQFEQEKQKLKDEYNIIQKEKEAENKEYIKLKENINEIETELRKTINDQLIQLKAKDDEIKMLKEAGVGFLVQKDIQLQLDVKNKELNESRNKIIALQAELEKVHKLLDQNANTIIEKIIDYDNCYNILQNLISLNNIFYRKQEIIKKLDEIITHGDIFIHLNEQMKLNIKNSFETVKEDIMKYITFLDIKSYISSPNVGYLKNKATQKKVPESFCNELSNLLDYWNENVLFFREQDRILTNIYEDLSGAVRVYIRIKPNPPGEKGNIMIKSTGKTRQKIILTQCGTPLSGKNEFGEFYGIFDETYSNLDLYTGIEHSTPNSENPLIVNTDAIIENNDTISPGLYSTFKQVEDGYSIVVFGYGSSGAGKTHSLLGNNDTPGLIQYGLANLKNVSNIKLKNLFELYYNNININFNKITGKIHSLIQDVPAFRKFSKDESRDFLKLIPNTININNINVDDINPLTNIINNYRQSNRRIKKTPNNPVSSRSHLFIVFEIIFESGKTGYITLIDMGGREDPSSLFKTFIKPGTSLASVMSPSGGEKLIEKYNNTTNYSSQDIYEILKEGIYINETINHLIYYFNKKNYKQSKVILQANDPDKYNVAHYYVQPFKEETSINEANNCLMIPILNFLDNLSNKQKSDIDFKPTKFITLVGIRQEDRYCDDIVKTLEFANNVKST